MGRTNGTPGAAALDWDGFDSASLGRLGLGEFGNVDTVGAASGSGPLPFTSGANSNLTGNIATFRFLNTAVSNDAVRGHYNSALHPVSLGVVSVNGNASIPLERPSNLSAGTFESAGVRVMQERNDVLAAPLSVSAVVNGATTITAPATGTLPQLASGVDFTSYVLHFDPVGGVAGQLRTVTGSVTFAEKIIGLVTADETLEATDARLGAIGNYGDGLRGVQWASGDFLSVSSDQLTLSFQLSSPSDQLMQLRVVTDLSTLLPPVGIPGDFNGDDVVDSADLALWSSAITNQTNAADADNDGDSDGADFLTWQRNLGATSASTPSAASAAVPEASGLVLLSWGLALTGAALRRSSGRQDARHI
jgi:hypothetical protein